MLKPELLIFNLDGGVIDVNQSITSAIRRTVQTYFSRFLEIHGSGSLVSEEAVQQFRLAGLQEPEQLSAALIGYLLSLLPHSFHRPSHDSRHINQAMGFVKKTSQPVKHLSISYLRKKADFAKMAARLEKAGGGVQALEKVMPAAWFHPLLMNQGEIDKGNLVGRLYWEIYLGMKKFSRLKRMPPRFWRAPGLIDTEKLLLDFETLQKLRAKYRKRMAVVTMRKRESALLVMKHFTIDRIFDVMITAEDILAEETRWRRFGETKSVTLPDPFMLLEAAAHLDYDGREPALFVGSTIVDMQAGQAADMKADKRSFSTWALLPSHLEAMKEQFASAGAQQVFNNPHDLATVLLR